MSAQPQEPLPEEPLAVAPPAPHVTHSSVTVAGDDGEDVVRALTWWMVRRPRMWRSLLIAYPVVFLLVVGGLSAFDLSSGRTVGEILLGLPLLVLGTLALLAGLAGLEVVARWWQVRRLVRRVVGAQIVVGNVTTVTITPTEVIAAYADSVHRIRTRSVVGGAWVGGVLVLETRMEFVLGLPADLVGPDGWALLSPVLGSRVRTVS